MLKFLLIASKIVFCTIICVVYFYFEDTPDWNVTCAYFLRGKKIKRTSNEIETDTDLKSVMEHLN